MKWFFSHFCAIPFLLLCLCVSAWAEQFVEPLELPVKISESDWQPLLETVHPELQASLMRELNTRADWQKLIAKRKMAIGLVDLTNPAAPRFAQVNGDVVMYAASLPKITILLTAFQQFETGQLQRTAEVEQDLNAMIRVSNNTAATRMIKRVGGLKRINDVLRDPQFHFYDKDNGGGLWMGKLYAKEGPRLPDPLKGISHAATVNQISRFYYQLATGKLISQKASNEMLEILANPAIEHKFVKSLHDRAPDADLYRKSGTWKRWHADSVLVWGPEWRRYILTAIIESTKGEQILRDLVGLAENVLHDNDE